MRKKVPAMDRKTVIQLLSEVSNGTRERALFNAVDVPMVRAICSKAKTSFNTAYGKSGITVTLGGK